MAATYLSIADWPFWCVCVYLLLYVCHALFDMPPSSLVVVVHIYNLSIYLSLLAHPTIHHANNQAYRSKHRHFEWLTISSTRDHHHHHLHCASDHDHSHCVCVHLHLRIVYKFEQVILLDLSVGQSFGRLVGQ